MQRGPGLTVVVSATRGEIANKHKKVLDSALTAENLFFIVTVVEKS